MRTYKGRELQLFYLREHTTLHYTTVRQQSVSGSYDMGSLNPSPAYFDSRICPTKTLSTNFNFRSDSGTEARALLHLRRTSRELFISAQPTRYTGFQGDKPGPFSKFWSIAILALGQKNKELACRNGWGVGSERSAIGRDELFLGLSKFAGRRALHQNQT